MYDSLYAYATTYQDSYFNHKIIMYIYVYSESLRSSLPSKTI